MARLGLLLMTVTWTLSAESEGKVWIFSVSANRRPFNYADETGKLVGFDLDLINKVCSTAGVKCAPTVQPFSECIQTVDGRFFPGRVGNLEEITDDNHAVVSTSVGSEHYVSILSFVGLMSGWFDACMGYTITQERVNAVQFTNPYIQTYAKFTVKPGNPRGVNLNTLSQATIITHCLGKNTTGFAAWFPGSAALRGRVSAAEPGNQAAGFVVRPAHLNGAYTNQQCLNRLNYSVSGVVVAPNLPVAKELVLNGTVDAAFSPRSRIPDLETLDITLQCDLGGVAVMVTKGSTLPDWWNPAYEKFVKSGEYQKMCEAWRSRSTLSIKCFEDASHADVKASCQTVAVVSWCLTVTMLLVSLYNSGFRR